jgi:hypothetical protein
MSNAMKRKRTWVILLVVIGVVVPGLFVLRDAVFVAQRASFERVCEWNAKQIATALMNYQRQEGCLPPPYLADARGKPLHSWRMLILPHLMSSPLQHSYKFDEPWDGPNNYKLAVPLSEYHCRNSSPSERWRFSSYLMVVRPNSAEVRPKEKVGTAGLQPSPSHRRILIVEIASSDVTWTEPCELELDDRVLSVNGDPRRSPSSHDPRGPVVIYDDGSVERLDPSLSPDQLRQLFGMGK